MTASCRRTTRALRLLPECAAAGQSRLLRPEPRPRSSLTPKSSSLTVRWPP